MDSEHVAPGAIERRHLGENSVTNSALQSGSVTGDKLASGAVKEVHLAAGAVQPHHLADHAVTSLKLSPESVSTDKLSDLAVTSTKLADGSVTSAKLAALSVAAEHLTPGRLAPRRSVTRLCKADILPREVSAAHIFVRCLLATGILFLAPSHRFKSRMAALAVLSWSKEPFLPSICLQAVLAPVMWRRIHWKAVISSREKSP